MDMQHTPLATHPKPTACKTSSNYYTCYDYSAVTWDKKGTYSNYYTCYDYSAVTWDKKGTYIF